MSARKFNNSHLPMCDTGERVMKCLTAELVRSHEIADRLSLCTATVAIHLRKLCDAGKAERVMVSGHPSYRKGTPKSVCRLASAKFAGYIGIGRGLANW